MNQVSPSAYSRQSAFWAFFVCTIAFGGIPMSAGAGGPRLVKVITPEINSSIPLYMQADGDQRIFFSAYDNVYGGQVWVSDGTETGTYMVDALGLPAVVLPCAGGRAFFSLEGDFGEGPLFSSNGTPNSTVYFQLTISFIRGACAMDSNLFFVGADADLDFELWKSDGTIEGTQMVKDLLPGSSGSIPSQLTDADGTLFFRTSMGNSLWKTDGTDAGTVLLGEGVRSSRLTPVNNRVFFRGASDSENPPDYELWATDGTPGGVFRVKDIWPGPDASDPQSLTAVGNRIFFIAQRQAGGPRELWVSDGTEAGTTMVDSQAAYDLVDLNGVLFFWRWDEVNGYRLWSSNGLAEGTNPIATIAPPDVEHGPWELTVVNGKLYFSADDGVHGRELWCYDPAIELAFMIADLQPGQNTYGPLGLTIVGTTLFFQQHTDVHGTELWAFDTREMVIPTLSTAGAVTLFVVLGLSGLVILKRRQAIAI